jgi:hypothetical protein
MSIKIPSDLAIIIHGLIDESVLTDVESIKSNVIFSCWNNTPINFKDFIVTKNDEPTDSRIGNLIKQSKSILHGCDMAKDIGFKRVLKIRGDMFIKNKSDFLNLIDNDDLNLFSWHFCDSVPRSKGYIVDYFMSGKIEDIRQLWDVDLSLSYPIAEQYITYNFLKKIKNSNIKYQFILDKITENNDIFWSKYKINLSSYNSHMLNYDGDLTNKDFVIKSYFGIPKISNSDLNYLYKFHNLENEK